MPRLEEFQLNLEEEYTQLGIKLKNNDLKSAETTAYFIYKRLQELNGNQQR